MSPSDVNHSRPHCALELLQSRAQDAGSACLACHSVERAHCNERWQRALLDVMSEAQRLGHSDTPFQEQVDGLASQLMRISAARAVVIFVTHHRSRANSDCAIGKDWPSETVGSCGIERSLAASLAVTLFATSPQHGGGCPQRSKSVDVSRITCLENVPEFQGTLLLQHLEQFGAQSLLAWQDVGAPSSGREINVVTASYQMHCCIALVFDHASALADNLLGSLRNLVSQWLIRKEHALLRDQHVQLREQVRAFESTMHDAVLVVSPDCRITSANDAACRLLGYPVGGLSGVSLEVVSRDAARTLDGEIRSGTCNSLQPCSYFARKRDGSEIQTECLLRSVGSNAGAILTMREVSDRVAIEERLRAADRLTMLGTLSRGLGHDINNMLFPMRAHLNALENSDAANSPSRTQHFGEIRGSVGYLQHLADALHYLAQDAEDSEVKSSRTALAHWWSQTSGLLSKALPRGVTLEVSIPESLPPVTVSAHSLSRAVLNLLVNAKEAMVDQRGLHKPLVVLRAESCEAQRRVVLSISDNGHGMSESVRRRAADMFFTTKPRGIGSGLGLPFVRAMLEGVGGRLEIRSSPRNGTEIRLILPIAETPRVEAAQRVRIDGVDGRVAAMLVPLFEVAGVSVDSSLPRRRLARARSSRGARVRSVRQDQIRHDLSWMKDETDWPNYLVLGGSVATTEAMTRWFARRAASQLLIVGELDQELQQQCQQHGVHIVPDAHEIDALRRAIEVLSSHEEGVTVCP